VIATKKATLADVPVLQALATAQTTRYHALDSRLPEQMSLPGWLLLPAGGACWMALDGDIVLAALTVEPEHWPPSSPFANVFPRRYLRMRLYVQPLVDPAAVLGPLLDRVDGWPGAMQYAGRMLMMPLVDPALNAALRAVGFIPYHTLAHQLYPPALPRDALTGPGVPVRAAAMADIGAVAALMAESWRFHAEHQPAIQISPRLIEGCALQAEQLIGDDRHRVTLLAERGGEVVGFFAIGVSAQDSLARPALFASGYYGDIYEVGVRGDQRRAGVGTAMFHAALAWFEPHRVGGMFVNYAPTNPTSSRFWPRLGFRDAWVNWWRP
jgi:GNAT superfamily N-acetyltransferase